MSLTDEERETITTCWEEILDVLEKHDCRMTQSFTVNHLFGGQEVFANVTIVPVEQIFAGKTSRKDRYPSGLKVYG